MTATPPTYAYQDDVFSVPEVRGRTLSSLRVFIDDGLPQKLLGRLSDGSAFHAYLDAFIGFWSSLDDEGHESVREDYEGFAEEDVLARFGLHDCPIVDAGCRRIDGATTIEIEFRSGTLRLRALDPSDPGGDSDLDFVRPPA